MRCTYDPATKGGDAPDNKKVKGTIHWVSAAQAVPLEARLYDHLFQAERPMDVPPEVDWVTTINQASFEKADKAVAEPCLASAKSGDRFQFERLGYFCCDPDTRPGRPVFEPDGIAEGHLGQDRKARIIEKLPPQRRGDAEREMGIIWIDLVFIILGPNIPLCENLSAPQRLCGSLPSSLLARTPGSFLYED